MDDLITIKKNIKDIIDRPHDYSDEELAVAIEILKNANSYLRDSNTRLIQNLMFRMELDSATKMIYKFDDKICEVTLKENSTECKEKNLDTKYQAEGFDPLEIGDWIFKPSFRKAKIAAKFGGKKKEFIEKYFKKTGSKRLEFKEK